MIAGKRTLRLAFVFAILSGLFFGLIALGITPLYEKPPHAAYLRHLLTGMLVLGFAATCAFFAVSVCPLIARSGHSRVFPPAWIFPPMVASLQIEGEMAWNAD